MWRPGLVLAMCAAACYRTKPDDATRKQLAKIEQHLTAQDKAIADARSTDSRVELGLLAERIAELTAQVAELQDKLGKQATPPKRRAPDPSAVYAYPLGTSPALGSPKAKVTMVMVYEYACHYCRRAWDTVDALRKKYGKNLRVVYKQFVIHPAVATAAATASCAANLQGKWRPMADLLWTKAHDTKMYDQEHIDVLAAEAGLDMARYKTDAAGACPTEIADDNELARKFAVNGTPSFFVNGRYVSGSKDQRTFEILIDEEMRRADAAIKAGVKAEDLYAQEVLGKGLPEVAAP